LNINFWKFLMNISSTATTFMLLAHLAAFDTTATKTNKQYHSNQMAMLPLSVMLFHI